MHHIKSIKIISIILLANILSACGGGGGSDPVAPGDTTPPAIVSGLQGNNPILPTATLVYVFSETLDTNSLDLTGTTIVTGGMPSYLFSTTTVSDDTITFTSSSDWVAGDLAIDVADLAGNKISDQSGNPFTSTFTIDSVAPVGTPDPATDSVINTTTGITIAYDEKISNTTVTIGGNMAAQAATATVESTRIIIAPASTWTVSDNQSLTIAVTDLAGNIDTLSLTYHVLDGGVHVSSTNGVDTNTGSAGSPKATIQAAINIAQTVFTTGEVRVAAGAYDETLTMVNGISLLGGYTADFQTRDPAANVSTITDTSSSSAIGAITASFITIADTLLDGFTINGSSTKRYAIYSWGNYTDIGLTISNNIITGGSTPITAGIILLGGATINGNIIDGGSGTTTSYGVYIPYSNGSFRPVVNAFDNIITGGGVTSSTSYGFYSTNIDGALHNNVINAGAATGNTFGVSISNSSGLNIYSNHIDGGSGSSFSTGLHLYMFYSLVYNNTIYGGSPGTGTARAIFLVSSSTAINQAKIFNNTLDAGSSTVANGNHGIFFSGSGAENEIINNNFIGRDAATTHCLYDNASSISLIKTQNNNFFNCAAIYTGTVAYATIAELEATSLFTASGNVSVDPVTISATDYHLTSGSPASVVNGGLDLSSFFTTDKDGVNRGFSMGAYVYVP